MKLAWIVPGLLASLGVVAVLPTRRSTSGSASRSTRTGADRRFRWPARPGTSADTSTASRRRRDFQHHERFTVWRHRRYRQADSGYRSRYAPRPVYQQAYRAASKTGTSGVRTTAP